MASLGLSKFRIILDKLKTGVKLKTELNSDILFAKIKTVSEYWLL